MICSELEVISLLDGGMIWSVEPDTRIGTELENVPWGEWARVRFQLGKSFPPDKNLFAFSGSEWQEWAPPWGIRVGDYRVIKEPWAISKGAKDIDAYEWRYQGWTVWYKADGATQSFKRQRLEPNKRSDWTSITTRGPWREAKTMPLYFSRLTAYIHEIRVLRARDIPESFLRRPLTPLVKENNYWCWLYGLALSSNSY